MDRASKVQHSSGSWELLHLSKKIPGSRWLGGSMHSMSCVTASVHAPLPERRGIGASRELSSQSNQEWLYQSLGFVEENGMVNLSDRCIGSAASKLCVVDAGRVS